MELVGSFVRILNVLAQISLRAPPLPRVGWVRQGLGKDTSNHRLRQNIVRAQASTNVPQIYNPPQISRSQKDE